MPIPRVDSLLPELDILAGRDLFAALAQAERRYGGELDAILSTAPLAIGVLCSLAGNTLAEDSLTTVLHPAPTWIVAARAAELCLLASDDGAAVDLETTAEFAKPAVRAAEHLEEIRFRKYAAHLTNRLGRSTADDLRAHFEANSAVGKISRWEDPPVFVVAEALSELGYSTDLAHAPVDAQSDLLSELDGAIVAAFGATAAALLRTADAAASLTRAAATPGRLPRDLDDLASLLGPLPRCIAFDAHSTAALATVLAPECPPITTDVAALCLAALARNTQIQDRVSRGWEAIDVSPFFETKYGYVLLAPQGGLRACRLAIDHVLAAEEAYLTPRSRALEADTAGVLRDGLGPQSRTWTNVSWQARGIGLTGGRPLRGEIDVVATAQDLTIIAECKSGEIDIRRPASDTKAAEQLSRLRTALAYSRPRDLEFRLSTPEGQVVMPPEAARELNAALRQPILVEMAVTRDDPIGSLPSYSALSPPGRFRPPLFLSRTDLRVLVAALSPGAFACHLVGRTHALSSNVPLALDEDRLISEFVSGLLLHADLDDERTLGERLRDGIGTGIDRPSAQVRRALSMAAINPALHQSEPLVEPTLTTPGRRLWDAIASSDSPNRIAGLFVAQEHDRTGGLRSAIDAARLSRTGRATTTHVWGDRGPNSTGTVAIRLRVSLLPGDRHISAPPPPDGVHGAICVGWPAAGAVRPAATINTYGDLEPILRPDQTWLDRFDADPLAIEFLDDGRPSPRRVDAPRRGLRARDACPCGSGRRAGRCCRV